MPSDNGLRLLINRTDLRETRLTSAPEACASPEAAPLAEGQARLAVRRFALTANNITYAAFGDTMKYWQFFPSGDEHWGCLPVWGFADVIESRAEAVAVGKRVYGFLPAGTHLVVQPGRVTARGFLDVAAHRADLPIIYNQLTFCDTDPGYQVELEPYQALLRPLFTTSFLIDDFLVAENLFGASQVLLSSASSKTAWGTALCLARRDAGSGRPLRIVGLTSAANKPYVQALGVYDEVHAYEELPGLDANERSIYVDFAGQAALRRAVHEHFGTALTYSCSVGGTHWHELGSSKGLPGPRPELFFAPTQYRRRVAPPPEGYGVEGLTNRLADAWQALMARVVDPGQGWLSVQEEVGATALEAGYRALLDGRSDPQKGLMLRW